MSSDDPDKPAQDAGNTITAAFPAPPPFWQNFTSENIKRFEDIRESELASHRRASEQGGGNQDARMEEDGPVGREGKDDKEEERGTIERLGLFDLPAELRYLIPPRIPEDGRYMSFGEEFNVRESLLSPHSFCRFLRVRMVRHSCGMGALAGVVRRPVQTKPHSRLCIPVPLLSLIYLLPNSSTTLKPFSPPETCHKSTHPPAPATSRHHHNPGTSQPTPPT